MAQDEAARVAFWVEYMEQSYALTEAIMRHPLQESREGFASIRAAAEAAGAGVRFSTTQLAGQFELELAEANMKFTAQGEVVLKLSAKASGVRSAVAILNTYSALPNKGVIALRRIVAAWRR